MSRTKRKSLVYSREGNPKVEELDDTQLKWRGRRNCKPKKLSPYIKDVGGAHKYTPYSVNYNHRNTGNGARTGCRNANRSLKKGLRQQQKLEIKKELCQKEIQG